MIVGSYILKIGVLCRFIFFFSQHLLSQCFVYDLMLRFNIILCAVARNRNNKSTKVILGVTTIRVYAIVQNISFIQIEGSECTPCLEGVIFISMTLSFGWSRQETVGLFSEVIKIFLIMNDANIPVIIPIPRFIYVVFDNGAGIDRSGL